METKPELRKAYRELRDGLPEEDRRTWSLAVCRRVEAFAASRRIRRVGAFWPLGSEVDLRPLVEAHPDWTFFFPRVVTTSPPRLAWGPEPLEPGLWGLMEPVHAQRFLPPVQLLLVPGLAFDEGGYRLGYGKGFYDALLARLDEDVVTLGAGFHAQRSGPLPLDPGDLPVQGLATERELVWFA
jgi:5-formyltetrahydrofolate cyclo-ligase